MHSLTPNNPFPAATTVVVAFVVVVSKTFASKTGPLYLSPSSTNPIQLFTSTDFLASVADRQKSAPLRSDFTFSLCASSSSSRKKIGVVLLFRLETETMGKRRRSGSCRVSKKRRQRGKRRRRRRRRGKEEQ